MKFLIKRDAEIAWVWLRLSIKRSEEYGHAHTIIPVQGPDARHNHKLDSTRCWNEEALRATRAIKKIRKRFVVKPETLGRMSEERKGVGHGDERS